MEFLSSLEAKIIIADSILKITKFSLPILTSTNPVDTIHTVPLNTKVRLSLPMNLMEWDFLFKTTTLSNDLSITGGLYTAVAGFAHFEVCNMSD